MEKALDILKKPYHKSKFNNATKVVYKEEQIKEVIAELEEAMKPKTCDSCKTCEHYSSGKQSDNFGWEKCGWGWECKRKYEDRYEPKATT